MDQALTAIFQRRAIKVFEQSEISSAVREKILQAACAAPSSFNSQPYRFYWVDSPSMKTAAARLCMGQKPANTASALVVAVADLGSWQSTTQGQLEFIRGSGVGEKKVRESERRAKLAKWFFVQGWFNTFGALKWLLCRIVNIWKIIGMPPASTQALFKWAYKNTALACENLMIAAEAMGLGSCPMDGFDGRRLSKFLGLSRRYHEIVMVIAIGKKIRYGYRAAAMAQTARGHGDCAVIVHAKQIPEEILKDSVLLHLAAAYFSVGKQMEQKTQCSQTRGFVMSTLRGGVELNQNQIAKLLGFDRTVVHRVIKTMVQEGLISEKKQRTGRAILLQLTPQGNRYRERLIKERHAADEKLTQALTPEERAQLIKLLKVIGELKI